MKIIGELYKENAIRGLSKIETDDISSFKNGLTIHNLEIVGKDRMGILLSFKETHLVHKCNRTDVFAIAEEYKLSDTDMFVGKKVFFAEVDKNVRIVFGNKDNKKITAKK